MRKIDQSLDQKEHKRERVNHSRKIASGGKEKHVSTPELQDLHGKGATSNAKKTVKMLLPGPGDVDAEQTTHRGKNSKLILNRLKVHYLRTRDTKRAVTFLYGRNLDGK